jgi:hypothetical protein
MIHLLSHDIARQRHQELLAGAERYRLAQMVRDPAAHRLTKYRKTAFAARFRRANAVSCRSEV